MPKPTLQEQQEWFEAQCKDNGQPFASLPLTKGADGKYTDELTQRLFEFCVDAVRLTWGE